MFSPSAADEFSDLTLEQKAAALSGRDFWTAGVRRLFALSDGPNGVRRQVEESDHLGMNAALPATCFPPGVAMGQSWDPELVRRIGAALSTESRALGVDVLLGPGINIKRDPRGGRNFEYLSEDPWLSGTLGAAWVDGVQGGGVGASVKHFAVNNQEWDRMRASSDVDARPLREIYLRAFERVVRDARPWTVMSAYNSVNNVPASESPWLLTTVLRDEWGFDGIVISDWGAVRDRVRALEAGLDLEMPANAANVAALIEAVTAGEIAESVLDTSLTRLWKLESRIPDRSPEPSPFDVDGHHALAGEAARRAIVLLQNTDGLLPLERGTRIAVIGELARTPRYQGGGSSHITPTRLDIPLDELTAVLEEGVSFAPGYSLERGAADAADAAAERIDAAVRLAAEAEVAVLFLGLPAHAESEGFDRDDVDLPADQRALAAAVLAAQPRTVLVLSHGGLVLLPAPLDSAAAILDASLLGQAGGGAIAATLVGDSNPSGRLAETLPKRLADAPSFLNFPGTNAHVRYGEGIHVGYRWYDAREIEVAFPFGHGLSYTDFKYSALVLSSSEDGGAIVEVVITNTGQRSGREIVQVYAQVQDSATQRPRQELVGSAVVDLEPGAARTVRIVVEARDLAYWEDRVDRWQVEGGIYEFRVGASSRDIRVMGTLRIDAEPLLLPITLESTIGELAMQENAAPVLAAMSTGLMGLDAGDAIDLDLARIAASTPLRVSLNFAGDAIDLVALEQAIRAANVQAGYDAVP